MTGLVLEGGAMRALFSAGVTDVMMENGLLPDAVAAVSAGATFGCNIRSAQPGRVLRYNTRFCRDWRYGSIRSWLLTGDMYNVRFCYDTLPRVLDRFDTEAFAASGMAFYVVCTDVETGRAVCHPLRDGGEEDLKWIRASASLPIASRMVGIGGRKYLDGGIADSIPLKALGERGYPHSVVVLTQPAGFVKQPSALLPLIRILYRRYPAMVEALENRHQHYNDAIRLIEEKEAAGQILVIRPDHALEVHAAERDPERLRQTYLHGVQVALRELDRLRAFFADGRNEGAQPGTTKNDTEQ